MDDNDDSLAGYNAAPAPDDGASVEGENESDEDSEEEENRDDLYADEEWEEAKISTQKSFVRYCNVTFVAEGGQEDVKLKRCAQCKLTFYKSKEEQKQHWSVHKQLCKPPSQFADMKQNIFAGSAEDVLTLLRDNLMTDQGENISMYIPNSPIKGYLFLWVLQRLEELAKDKTCFSAAYRSTAASYIVHTVMFLTDQHITKLWAVPGMANYLLNLDIRSNNARCIIHFFGVMTPAGEMFDADGFNPQFHINGDFCSLVCSILAGTFMSDNPLSSNAEPAYRPGIHRLANAASAKVMEFCSDPWSFASIPWSMGGDHRPAVKASLLPILTMIVFERIPEHSSDSNQQHNQTTIAPGLSVENATRMLLWRIASDHNRMRVEPMKHWIKHLYKSRDCNPIAWNAFSVQRRAVLAGLIMELFVFGEEDVAGVKNLSEEFLGCTRDLMGFVCGWLLDMSMWLNVLPAAKKGYQGDYFADWMETILNEVRPSLQEHLRLHKWNLPENLEDLICEFALDVDSNMWEKNLGQIG